MRTSFNLPRWAWPVLAAVAASVAFVRGLTGTNIFYIRDLTMFFWPRHLLIRDSLLAGHWPSWDPYAAAGQPIFPDALNQLFLLPVLLLRILLPAVVGFNLIVALPFPLAALGAWLFLRRHVSPVSATVNGPDRGRSAGGRSRAGASDRHAVPARRRMKFRIRNSELSTNSY